MRGIDDALMADRGSVVDLARTGESGPRVYLSAPQVDESDIEAVVAALRSGWVAPVGPDLAAFEQDMCAYTGAGYGVALSSGTAALHLGLRALGVGPGDEVVVPTLTFAATAFAVVHAGATPVFLDVEARTWNLDPELLDAFLRRRAAAGHLPAAIIPVDLFGRMCDYDRILPIARDFGVPVLEDAAEALGSTYQGRQAGTFGAAGIFSFNGNKIISTSGGGMLVTDDGELAAKVRHWATQSREDLPWYEHFDLGFNYRMSNVLAALGRSQLSRLPQLIQHRRAINHAYRELLNVSGVIFPERDVNGRENCWLTTVLVDEQLGTTEGPAAALHAAGVESRPVWKPMHQQPYFRSSAAELSGVADRLFNTGLCLPSGTRTSEGDVARIADVVGRSLQ